MSTTLLITLAQPNPDETERFHGYVAASTALALRAGAEVSSRFGVRHLIGDAPAVVFGLATFPSADAITTMFDSDGYQALVPDRDGSSLSGVLMLDVRSGAFRFVEAQAVLLATGGGPTMYRYHTPSGDKSMDGLGLDEAESARADVEHQDAGERRTLAVRHQG